MQVCRPSLRIFGNFPLEILYVAPLSLLHISSVIVEHNTES